jgi:hypothetical protein
MSLQIPYAAIGTGIVLLLGVWAFVVAETALARVLIAAIPTAILLVRWLFRPVPGRLVSFVALMLYGVGLVVFLRLSGVRVR